MLCLVLSAMPVSAATCSVSATGISLGTYAPNQTMPADSAGSIVVTCAKGALDSVPMTVAYTIDVSRGGSSAFSPRDMTSGAHTLRYNLYRDASRNIIWGDTTDGTSNVTGALQLQPSPSTASATHTLYGRIFAGQNAYPGAYADSIVVTVGY